jgi:hypothetical protein
MGAWKETWGSALQAASDAVRDKAPAARKLVEQIGAAREPHVKQLAAALKDGALDRASIDAELADERAFLETEFKAIHALDANAARAAARALIAAVERALPARGTKRR